MSDAARLMDTIYASQRHIYDLTRKFYLLGRDELIADLSPPQGGRVLEIGCGTARNLIRVARRYPGVTCYGVDVSTAMLKTAHRSVAKARLGDRINLAEADATAFDPLLLYGIPNFDRVMISYALSMISPWREALDHASTMLAKDGSLHIVDFGDQADLPRAFRRLLETWLSLFHVSPRRSLPSAIRAIADARGLQAVSRSQFRGYAVRLELAAKGSSKSL